MKILFFGTSNVALPVLEDLSRHHEIVGVVTQPDGLVGRKKEVQETPVAVLAKEINLKIFKPAKLTGSAQLQKELETLEPEISIVVSYGQLIPQAILDIPKFKTLNIHFSLLPKYRGAAPLQYAIYNGDTETGVTIFQLDELMDHGPVLASEKYNIDLDDNFLTLSQRLAYASAKLLSAVIPGYVSGLILPTIQDEALATFCKSISKQEGKIDWNKTAQQIYNQFRAFYPWPGIWTIWKGNVLKIMDCAVSEYLFDGSELIGAVVEGGLVVCGQNTILKVKSLQPGGKTETDTKSFLNGNRDFIGSRLG